MVTLSANNKNRLLACLFVSLLGFAQAGETFGQSSSPTLSEPVSVMWPLHHPDSVHAFTATPDNVFSSVTIDTGDLELSGPSTTYTAIYPDSSSVYFTRFMPSGGTSSIEWKLSIAEGRTFTPTRISAYIARFGTDAGNGITISAVADDGTVLTLGTFTAPRNNRTKEEDKFGSNDNYTSHFVIELTAEQQETLTTTKSLSVFGTLGVSSTKEAGYADFTIEGLASSDVTFEPAQLSDGRYYLKNVGAQLWLGAGNSWGTQASLLPHAEYVTLHAGDGYYTIESQVNNGGSSYWLGNNGYMDNSEAAKVYIALGSDGYYRLTDADNGSTLGYDGETTVLYAAATGINACWQILTEEEMLAGLATATAEAPVDATWKILDPNFGRNNVNVSAWTVSDNCTNKNLSGGNNVNNCAESWHSAFDICQTLTGLPNGTYTLKAQGFYRQDGNDEENMPVFYANDQTARFPLKEGSENSMSEASVSFSAGTYTIAPITVFVTDSTLQIGVKSDNLTMWCIWDNFELTYYGPDYTYIDNYDELLAKATELAESDNLTEAVVAALSAAIAMSIDTADDRAAAIEALTAAISLAEGCIIALPKLTAMKALTESTNFYTAEAYNTYYQQWADKLENGTLTRAEANGLQNPYDVTSWHSAVTVDDLLLSVWDTNPDFVNAPYYVNTWSVEGNTDGTGFVVPFIEYWTSDYNILDERTLTATLTGLEKGSYDVTLRARVRLSNYYSGTPTGITMQVNGDDAVSLTDGENLADRFYIGTFTATGYVTDDGTLTLTITVSGDNNISWLSFKDVNYAYTGAEDPKAIDADEWAVLKEAYATMGGEGWKQPWTFGEEPATARDLPGVKVSGGKVVGIALSGNNVTGRFPAALLQLQSLAALDLSGNALSGNAEETVDGIANTALTTLDVSNNALTGNIGALAEKMSGLTTLLAGGNQFESVSPAISSAVTTLDISRQTIGTTYSLALADLLSADSVAVKLPGIVTYVHAGDGLPVDRTGLVLTDSETAWTVEVVAAASNIQATCPAAQNVFFGNSGSTFAAKAADSGTTFPLTLDFDDGDCNFDGLVDVLDLQADVNYIFNEYSQQLPYNFTAANLWVDESDGQQINLQDIILEVNVLLSQVNEVPASARAAMPSGSANDEEYAEATVQIGGNGHLTLATTRPVAALDVTAAGAQAFELAEAMRQQGFVCATRLQADGLHIVVYSLKGALMPVGETVVGTLSADSKGTVSVTRASLSDKEAQRISAGLNTLPTGIEEIVNSKSSNSKSVYDLQGRRMESSIFNVQSSIQKKGIYVNQGRKVIVK